MVWTLYYTFKHRTKPIEFDDPEAATIVYEAVNERLAPCWVVDEAGNRVSGEEPTTSG